jgi:hypothetical protein
VTHGLILYKKHLFLSLSLVYFVLTFLWGLHFVFFDIRQWVLKLEIISLPWTAVVWTTCNVSRDPRHLDYTVDGGVCVRLWGRVIVTVFRFGGYRLHRHHQQEWPKNNLTTSD